MNGQPSYPSPSMPQQQPYLPPLAPSASRHKRHAWLLIVPLVFFILLFLGAAGFGFWAFAEREDYKNNSDQKAAAAAEVARQQAAEEKEKEFLEREKNPFKEYKGPSTFGSVSILYPKTWAAAVDETGKGGAPISGFFHPNFVPGQLSDTAFALRLQIVEQAYDQILAQFDGKAKTGKVRVEPFKLAKVPAVLGSRVDGEIETDLNGSIVLLPLRDKTIKISVQSQQFVADFNNIILPNLVFIP